MQIFAELKAGSKGQHSWLPMISTSMRNWNKITALSHTLGWQEVHAVVVVVCHSGVTHHSCGSASAASYHAGLSLLLVVIDTWDTLYQWLPANEIAFLQRSPKNSTASWCSRCLFFVLLWNFFLWTKRTQFFSSLSMSLSAPLFGLWLV